MQLLTFQRVQAPDKDGLPWYDSSENLVWVFFKCYQQNNLWIMCVGVGLLAFPLQLALIFDSSL